MISVAQCNPAYDVINAYSTPFAHYNVYKGMNVIIKCNMFNCDKNVKLCEIEILNGT